MSYYITYMNLLELFIDELNCRVNIQINYKNEFIKLYNNKQIETYYMELNMINKIICKSNII